ncbi:helix-turn-helix domain-containing protein [Catellatospora methionotrophica]|uniref:helix-turn-helix domain-containing protein n=1 Tax=Catellatospora methionotrophica TaxID=121620 RepID=UPI0033E66D77
MLALYLRNIRAQRHMTLAQVAAKARYSVPTMSLAASGKRLPTREVVKAYVRACGGDQTLAQGYWEAAMTQKQSEQLNRGAAPVALNTVAPARVRPEAPRPAGCETAAELRRRLVQVKVWAGNPSLRRLSQMMESQPGASTLSDLFRPTRRTKCSHCGLNPCESTGQRVADQEQTVPRLDLMLDFLIACGIRDTLRWERVWNKLKIAEMEARWTQPAADWSDGTKVFWGSRGLS